MNEKRQSIDANEMNQMLELSDNYVLVGVLQKTEPIGHMDK